MDLTFVVTIDPVKDPSLLNLVVHSLNLQTCQHFNVVFHNQTLADHEAVLSRLTTKPAFDHCTVGIPRERFFGQYPVWDLYELHQTLLDRRLLNEYFISLHMEEFLDVDYVEQLLPVLASNRFDILFGNLTRTRLLHEDVEGLCMCTGPEFEAVLREKGAFAWPHWSFPHGLGARMLREAWPRATHRLRFGRRLHANDAGYTAVPTYFAEDVYWMNRDFAERHNWFLRGHRLSLEDIHVCQQKGICELGPVLQRLTRFPRYFNRRRIYHVPHRKFFYQLLDHEFGTKLLAHFDQDPVLDALRTAIDRYRRNQFTFRQALRHTLHNPDGTGTQDLNYRYHMMCLEASLAQEATTSGGASRSEFSG